MSDLVPLLQTSIPATLDRMAMGFCMQMQWRQDVGYGFTL